MSKPSEKDITGVEQAALAAVYDFTGRKILEIGCGDGRLTWSYAARAKEVLAIDPSESSIASARSATPPALAGHVRFETARIERIALPESYFDAALFTHSI